MNEQNYNKTHAATLEVNLKALISNLNYYKSKVPAQTKFVVMVKAFSYGAGDYLVAKALENAGVEYLGVAYADEGVALRRKGILCPIIVMNSSPEDYRNLIKYNLEPEIYSVEKLLTFSQFINRRFHKQYNIHLKLDSGMHRLGIQVYEIDDLILALSRSKNLKVASIFSHPAASDEPKEDEFTLNQIKRFTRMYDKIADAIQQNPLKHILNSSGIERFPEYAFDMVRLGIGIYGVNVSKPENVIPVSTLKTKILQVKKVKKGETIGYSRNGVAGENTKIAIIALGYADGFRRKLGNGNAKVLINGELCPTIGNVSMDMTSVDVSNISAKAGDEVIVFGSKPRVQTLAEQLDTIAYEVFTSISQRVRRIYIDTKPLSRCSIRK